MARCSQHISAKVISNPVTLNVWLIPRANKERKGLIEIH